VAFAGGKVRNRSECDKSWDEQFMYLRNVGIGYQIKGTIDQDLVYMLAKINRDQGGLAGLLNCGWRTVKSWGRTIPTTCVEQFTAYLNASSKCRQRCFILRQRNKLTPSFAGII
jgi:hypothetical protein